jgi:F420-dependent oxidoreductase-like protein
MRLGLQVPNFTWPLEQGVMLGERFGQIAEHADRAGFYSFWVMDHFFQIRGVGPAEHEMLEGYSALSYAAALSKQMKLGTMVTGVTYRQPGILVKTVTTLDVLSGGRAYLGIGAAWNEEEHAGLGVPFPPVAERFRRLEETLQIARQMWSSNEQPYNGRYYQLARPLNSPQSVQRPHPPILIGGGGEQKTLRLVAQYADACNLFARMGRDVLQHKLNVLRDHCEAIGRPYEQIEKRTLNTVHITRDGRGDSMTPRQAIEYFREQAAMGIDQAIFNMPNVYDLDVLDLIGDEIIPEVSQIPVEGR